MGSPNGSNDTAHIPPPLSFYNTLKNPLSFIDCYSKLVSEKDRIKMVNSNNLHWKGSFRFIIALLYKLVGFGRAVYTVTYLFNDKPVSPIRKKAGILKMRALNIHVAVVWSRRVVSHTNTQSRLDLQ